MGSTYEAKLKQNTGLLSFLQTKAPSRGLSRTNTVICTILSLNLCFIVSAFWGKSNLPRVFKHTFSANKSLQRILYLIRMCTCDIPSDLHSFSDWIKVKVADCILGSGGLTGKRIGGFWKYFCLDFGFIASFNGFPDPAIAADCGFIYFLGPDCGLWV